ncbi:MAG: 4-hydroxy-tetrahydrodipicolinate reductase [Candidatus Peregrinibacteria bacterium]
MNIAIVGYGSMGKEVEAQILKRGHTVAWIADDAAALKNSLGTPADCAIEFTAPHQTVTNIELLAENCFNVVVGTTGWYEELTTVRAIVNRTGVGVLYSPNLSIGVHLFWDIIAHAAKLINPVDNYDVFGHEYHHAKKADAPSGTALETAKIILRNFPRKQRIVTTLSESPIKPEELQFSSTRGGNVPGTHSVYFDSAADTIEITHTARNRAGFTAGAVTAAEWLRGRKGIFTMADLLSDLS